MRIGIRAVSLTDSHLMQIQASQCGPDTAVIAISHTGKTREIVSAVRTAKSAARRPSASPATRIRRSKRSATSALSCIFARAAFRVAARGAVLLIDTLYVSLAIRRKDSVVQNIERMNEVLLPFRID